MTPKIRPATTVAPVRRWVLVVVGLYALILLTLTWPLTMIAFAPGISPKDALLPYATWPFWACLGTLVLAQVVLLVVPVRVTTMRPVKRQVVWLPVVAAGFAFGGLVVAGLWSLEEFLQHGNVFAWAFWSAVGAGVLTWLIWMLVFFRLGRGKEPLGVVTQQCQYLFRGSILELLIAVPTHIIARVRNYCSAGFMTFFGLMFGIAVMLFAFGPSVFFLYVARWKRLHPAREAPRGTT